MLSISMTLLLTATPFAFSSPLAADANNEAAVAVPEEWVIPELRMHFMTDYSGYPGGWPPPAHFDSEIRFKVHLPVLPSLASHLLTLHPSTTAAHEDIGAVDQYPHRPRSL